MDKISTVLIIEDDTFIGEMYVRSLRNSGYSVDWMVSGPDGLAAATTKTYDLILLDIMLPDTMGNDILTTLKPDEGNDKVPNSRIIVLTNFDQDDNDKEAMIKKVDAYLIKADITPRKLLEIIASIKPLR